MIGTKTPTSAPAAEKNSHVLILPIACGRNSASGKIPQKEYEILIKLPQAMPGQPQKRKCLFWNSTKGCDKGDDCRFVHRCMACNQDHRWCKRHM